MSFFKIMHFIMIQSCFYDTKIDYVKCDNDMWLILNYHVSLNNLEWFILKAHQFH
jgi:hypothetical protein